MNTFKSILSLAFIFLALSTVAQREDFERIEALKTKYITEELDLSPAEAQQFWPVYNQYRKELESIHNRRERDFKRSQMAREWDSKSDQELWDFINQELEDQEKIAKLKKQYLKEFAQAVGQRKAATYFRVETEFHRKLMRQLSRHRSRKP